MDIIKSNNTMFSDLLDEVLCEAAASGASKGAPGRAGGRLRPGMTVPVIVDGKKTEAKIVSMAPADGEHRINTYTISVGGREMPGVGLGMSIKSPGAYVVIQRDKVPAPQPKMPLDDLVHVRSYIRASDDSQHVALFINDPELKKIKKDKLIMDVGELMDEVTLRHKLSSFAGRCYERCSDCSDEKEVSQKLMKRIKDEWGRCTNNKNAYDSEVENAEDMTSEFRRPDGYVTTGYLESNKTPEEFMTMFKAYSDGSSTKNYKIIMAALDGRGDDGKEDRFLATRRFWTSNGGTVASGAEPVILAVPIAAQTSAVTDRAGAIKTAVSKGVTIPLGGEQEHQASNAALRQAKQETGAHIGGWMYLDYYFDTDVDGAEQVTKPLFVTGNIGGEAGLSDSFYASIYDTAEGTAKSVAQKIADAGEKEGVGTTDKSFNAVVGMTDMSDSVMRNIMYYTAMFYASRYERIPGGFGKTIKYIDNLREEDVVEAFDKAARCFVEHNKSMLKGRKTKALMGAAAGEASRDIASSLGVRTSTETPDGPELSDAARDAVEKNAANIEKIKSSLGRTLRRYVTLSVNRLKADSGDGGRIGDINAAGGSTVYRVVRSGSGTQDGDGKEALDEARGLFYEILDRITYAY